VFKNKKGFTLIEMTVVIGILAILATLAIPNIGNLTDTAKDTVQKANLKNLHTSMVSYKIDNNGLYPSQLSDLDINLHVSGYSYYANNSSAPQDYVVVTQKANSTDYVWSIEGFIVEGSYDDPTTANADTDGDSNTDEVDANGDGVAELDSAFVAM
jgi:prepilin-type N-terminal cleavage/methylation domain-containing protein